MKKAYYWLLIIILISLIVGVLALFLWYLQNEKNFNNKSSGLLISQENKERTLTVGSKDYIYWLEQRSEEIYLMAMRADGSEVENAVKGGESWPGRQMIEISPDGSKYAYLCEGALSDICIYDLNNDISSRIKIEKEVQDLAWTNDSNRLIFINKDSSVEKENNAIAVIGATGDDYKEIIDSVNLSGQPMLPTMSPDGQEILFQLNKENGDQGIYLMNIDGSNILPLMDSEKKEGGARFSPDGDKIVYHANDGSDQIYIMRSEGGDQKLLTKLGNNKDPYFSPDGQHIVFSSDRESKGIWEIFTMNIDGSEQSKLTNNDADNLWPRWHGNKIYASISAKIQDANTVLNAYITANISGGEASEISQHEHPDYLSQTASIDSYQKIYREDFMSYDLISERDIKNDKKEFEIKIKYRDNKESENIIYQLEFYQNQWLVSGVELKEKNIQDQDSPQAEEIKTGNIYQTREELEQRQSTADGGNDIWLLDPYEVARRDGSQHGFDSDKDMFTLISKIEKGDYSGTGEATVEISRGDHSYIVQLIQPIKQGNNGIWALTSIVKK